MKTKLTKLTQLFVLAAIAGLAPKLQAQLTFPNPGWLYMYNGEWTTTTNSLWGPNNPGGRNPTNTLDGTWNSNNSSSEWNGWGRESNNIAGPGGGISSTNGILTIEDINSTSGTANNRKVYFTHSFEQDGVANAGTILDTGITICFRARLSPADIVPGPWTGTGGGTNPDG